MLKIADAPPDAVSEVAAEAGRVRVTPVQLPVRRSVTIAASALVSLAVCGLAAAVAWKLFGPQVGALDAPDSKLPSVSPSPTFPMLDHSRERLYLFFTVLVVGASVAISPLVYRVIADRRRVVLAGLAGAQLLGALVMFVALSDRPLWMGDVPLDWGLIRAIAAENLGAAAVLFVLWWRATAAKADADTWLTAARRRRVRVVAFWGCAAVSAVLGVIYGANLLELSDSVRDGDTAWVVNELLAPANGMHGLTNFASAYSRLYGELVTPLLAVLSPEAATVGLIMVLLFATVGMLAVVLRRAGGLPWAVTALLTAGLIAAGTALKGDVPYPTPVGAFITRMGAFTYHQLMPVRMFAPVLLGLLVVLAAPRLRRRWLVGAGFVAALLLWNSPDFGFGAVAAAAVAVAGAGMSSGGSRPRERVRGGVRALGVAAAGFAAGAVAVVLLILVITGRLPDLSVATFYAREFGGSNLIVYPLEHAFGLQIAVIGTFAVGFLAAAGLWAWLPGGGGRDDGLRAGVRPLAAGLGYFSLFGFALFAYYLNRPVVLTLVASCFVIWALVLALLAVLAVRLLWRNPAPFVIGAFAVATVFFTVFAQIVYPPSLTGEIGRLTNGNVRGAALTGLAEGEQNEAVAFIEAHTPPGQDVMIIGVGGNLLAYKAGVRNVVPFAQMPTPVTTSELDLEMRAVQDNGYPDIYLLRSLVAPEVAEALSKIGYHQAAVLVPVPIVLLQHTSAAAPAGS